MKNDIEIKDDIFGHLKDSLLKEAVNGGLYLNKRPYNSTKEDIIISIISNVNGQIQEAFINVNVYVPDIFIDGQYEVDSRRCRELGNICKDLLGLLRGDSYRATLESQRIFEVDGANEHFINNRLLYRNNNE